VALYEKMLRRKVKSANVSRFVQTAGGVYRMIATSSNTLKGANNVLWTLCVILFVLWALGMATSYTAGGLIHILLVVAVVVILFNVISGRRAV